MTTIAEVRDELAEICGNIDGWRGSGYVAAQVNPRVVVVAPDEFDPRLIFSQVKAEHVFRLTAYAAITAPEASQKALDELAELSGDGSLIEAVQDSTNWSVTVDYAQVTRVGIVGVAEVAGVEYLARSFDVEVVF